jgi:chemotaxis protein methyltransferase CheR
MAYRQRRNGEQTLANYSAVIVDEVQDISEIALRLLHSLVGDRPDGLLLIGDATQRIFTRGYSLKGLGIDIAGLLLGRILPERGAMEAGAIEAYEVEHDFPDIGRRTMLLNARKVFYEVGLRTNILLGIEDVTEKRVLEREKDELLRQKDVLLDEMQHRVANSLQIIASIIMLKAKTVNSEETRRHLQDAHQRVMSVAAVQQHLHASAPSGPVQLGSYLSKLCEALSHSMVGDNRSISLKVCGEGGSATSRDAESLGLIVTELVINSLKHAFSENTKDGQITVAFDVSGTDWKLSIVDNGIGKPDGVFAQPKAGLGTGIVNALAKQLDAKVVTLSGPKGTAVSVTHATFAAKVIRAA